MDESQLRARLEVLERDRNEARAALSRLQAAVTFLASRPSLFFNEAVAEVDSVERSAEVARLMAEG